jgi:hypothetical protein
VTIKTPLAIDCHSRKIWIDLDNSPHVPFFVPIIHELRQRGYNLLLTARDNAQVLELVDYHHLDCRYFGHRFGKNKLLKVLGTGARVFQLAPLILREKPDLALSHGSRSQTALGFLLRIPSITIFDYEHAKGLPGFQSKWFMVPEILAGSLMRSDHPYLLKYPGLKEDVYVPRFRPTPGIREELGLSKDDLVVMIRPPASDAHYHNPMSDVLFNFVVEFLSQISSVRMVLLPRNQVQAASLRKQWPALFSGGMVRIPEHVVDGLNLIWFSDLVISGGGTMNREAAALGVPVYSIFRGTLGAVDRSLAAQRRLTLLESEEDVRTKLALVRRPPPSHPDTSPRPALQKIVDNIVWVLESEYPSASGNNIH